MLTCSDVMTIHPETCEPGDAVVHAAELMKQQDVGSLPVVDSKQSGRLVGIVTDRDLVLRVVAQDRSASSVRVGDVMTATPVSCRPDDTLDRALALMAEQQVRRIPVVDGEQRLVGIIAQADVATRVHESRETGALVEAISEPSAVRK
jgi:CBS domain-containing protein